MLTSNIREIIEAKGLSSSKLSKDLEISRASVFRYYNKPEVIQIGKLIQIAEYLEVSIFELIDGLGAKPQQTPRLFVLETLRATNSILQENITLNAKTIKELANIETADPHDWGRRIDEAYAGMEEVTDLLERQNAEWMHMVFASEDLKYGVEVVEMDREIGELQNEFMSLAFP